MPRSAIDEALEANRRFAARFQAGALPRVPARGLAIVACMDARVEPIAMLGLAVGDAHVLRNAGPVVTDDVVRSLLVSHHVGRTSEVMVVGHTQCGMATFRDEEMRERLERETGRAAVEPAAFHAFTDLEAHIARQVRALRSHPWFPAAVTVRGFVYDVATGALREVPDGAPARRAPAPDAGVAAAADRPAP